MVIFLHFFSVSRNTKAEVVVRIYLCDLASFVAMEQQRDLHLLNLSYAGLTRQKNMITINTDGRRESEGQEKAHQLGLTLLKYPLRSLCARLDPLDLILFLYHALQNALRCAAHNTQ